MNQDGLRSDASSVEVLISLADLYIENGLIKEAKGLLETAIKQNKGVIEPYLQLGSIYIEEGNTDMALEVLSKAERIDPRNKNLQNMFESIGVKKEEEETVSLDDLLKREMDTLLKIQGILGIILVDEVGSPILAELKLPLNEDDTGVVISSIYKKIEDTFIELSMGDLRNIFLELPGGNILVFGTSSLRLIILYKKGTLYVSKGNEIRKVFKKIVNILGED
ncbi:hypothetical protein KAW48_03380 [candidate division WOR-3 bacterium]|nr:hypothetical protein [candidate division WOR-3 bacterium]